MQLGFIHDLGSEAGPHHDEQLEAGVPLARQGRRPVWKMRRDGPGAAKAGG